MKKPYTQYGRYGSVGIEMVLSLLLGLYAGSKGDKYFHNATPWLTILGIVIGAYAGFRVLWNTATKMQRDIERQEQDEQDDRDGGK